MDPRRSRGVVAPLPRIQSSQFLPLEPFPPEAGPSRTRSSQSLSATPAVASEEDSCQVRTKARQLCSHSYPWSPFPPMRARHGPGPHSLSTHHLFIQVTVR